MMKIVTKNTFKIVKELSYNEREAIIAQFSSTNPSQHDSTLALQIASLAKSSEAWIQCDCTQSPPAFLFPRQTESGTITLVRPRPPRQNSHHIDCVFYLDNLPGLANSQKQTTRKLNDFCLLKPASIKTEAKSDNEEPTIRQTNELPRLTRILFDLISDAGLNIINNSHPYKNAFKSIYSSASKHLLWPSSSLKLSDVLTASKEVSYFYMLINRLKTNNEFGNRRKQGYFVTLIDQFTENTITVGSTFITVKGSIHAPNRVSKGPFWAILLVGEQKPGSNYFEALRASIWPAYSEKLPFIVDSDPERATLKELLSWRLYWLDRGLDIFSITKPLDFSTIVRPDFLVQDEETGCTVIIETMGSDDPSYLDRKLSMHEDMAKIGTVIEHRPGDDSLNFKKLITAAIIK